jgi:hypothetical protein
VVLFVDDFAEDVVEKDACIILNVLVIQKQLG